jgi:hypothetical protein
MSAKKANNFVTKAQIQQGKDYTEKVKTSVGTFVIRALTIGEKGIADSILTKGLLASGGIKGPKVTKIDGQADAFMENMMEYNCFIIAASLTLDKPDAEQWTPADVKSAIWPDEVVDTLVVAIEKCSHLNRGAAVEAAKGFRKKSSRK